MSDASFDRDGWEKRWQQVMTTHADMLATKAPSFYVTDELADLFTGTHVDGTRHADDAPDGIASPTSDAPDGIASPTSDTPSGTPSPTSDTCSVTGSPTAADVPAAPGHGGRESVDAPNGRVLDAGAGHGAEALWLAQQGWDVTAVDFSSAALDFGSASAETAGADVAARIEWVEADLGNWAPSAESYDVVLCLYVHAAGDIGEMIDRLAGGVRCGGTLFMVGHQAIDPLTGEPTRAAGQHQVSVAEARAALRATDWEFVTLEERRRHDQMGGVDAVIRATRIG